MLECRRDTYIGSISGVESVYVSKHYKSFYFYWFSNQLFNLSDFFLINFPYFFQFIQFSITYYHDNKFQKKMLNGSSSVVLWPQKTKFLASWEYFRQSNQLSTHIFNIETLAFPTKLIVVTIVVVNLDHDLSRDVLVIWYGQV